MNFPSYGWGWQRRRHRHQTNIVRSIGLNLVTFAQAKAQLSVDHDLDDDLINDIRSRASASVVNYCKIDIDETAFNWVDLFYEPITANLPPEVAAATLLVIGAMYENRDGDVFRSPQPLSQPAMDLLWRHRDPAMA